MCTIGTLPPGAKSLKLILAPPGMDRPLSMGVMSLATDEQERKYLESPKLKLTSLN